MQTSAVFTHRRLPWLLLAPQLAVTIIFFVWPAIEAVYQSFLREDAFGLSRQFVGLENFTALFEDTRYLHVAGNTLVFSLGVTAVSMSLALLLAVLANGVIRGAGFYKLLLVWPYAVAPALAGIIWLFMFHPTIGPVAQLIDSLGGHWNHQTNGTQAMILVILAASWKQISYNFLFFLAGLQAIPRSLLEAAAIDGAGPFKRFKDIVFPLLSPTSFFLLVVNIVYAFFDTFGTIHTMTRGGPGDSTRILVYKVYEDSFIGLNLGSSAAQSVILLLVVSGLTVIQFRYIERRVQY